MQSFITSPIAQNFIAIFILGVCAALLYLALGHAWDYTHWIMNLEYMLVQGAQDSSQFMLVSLTTFALLSGIFFASLVAHSFKLAHLKLKDFILKFLGGGLMGIGAGFIEGGNDTLILYGIPTLAFHAPFAILFIMLAIAMVLIFKTRFLG